MFNQIHLTAKDIVPFFIAKGVTPLKLQKLLYYSQVWYYKKYNQKLFTDTIKAWVYGPVVRDIWDRFKVVKRNDIINQSVQYYPTKLTLPHHIIDHLEQVWYAYGHLSGSDLVQLTHSELPWILSRCGLDTDTPSDNEVIINEYTTQAFQLDYFNRIPYKKSSNSLGYFHS